MTTSEFPSLQRTTRQNDNLGFPDWLSITFQSSITPHSSCYKSASFKNKTQWTFIDHQQAKLPAEGGWAFTGKALCPAHCLACYPGRTGFGFSTEQEPHQRPLGLPAFPPPPWCLSHIGCRYNPNEIISGLMETETGTSSSDIIRVLISEKIQSSIFLIPKGESIKNIILNKGLCR